MRRFIGSFAVSGLVGVCFTSAAVLGQVGGGAAEPAPAPAANAKKAAGKAGAVKQKAATLEERRRAIEADAAVQKDVRVNAVFNKAAQPGQANRAPLIQQFNNQARPLLRAEIIFARNVCHLNREELRKVNRDAQEMLEQVVTKLVDAQFQPRTRVQFNQKGQAPHAGLDSHQLLQDGVASVMKKNLSGEQWTRYQAERQKRDENRKRATIRYFVDAIDRELYLTPTQCSHLASALNDNWDVAWTMYLENHLFGNKFYPISIDPLVIPLLSNAQKRVWGGVQKVGVYWGFAGMLAGFVNDADGLEIELGEPAKPEIRRLQRQLLQGVVIEAKDAVEGPSFKTTVKMKVGAEKAKAKAVVRDPEQKSGKAGN